MTLLEQAKSLMAKEIAAKLKAAQKTPHEPRAVTREAIEVVIAFLKGEITQRAATVTLGEKDTWRFTQAVSRYIREGYENGWLTINTTKNV